MIDIYSGVIYFTEEDLKKASKNITGTEPEAEKVRTILMVREDEIYRRILDCMDFCTNLGLESAPVCEIGESIIEFEYIYINQSLDECEKYFSKIEDYETCSRILDLRSRIESLEDIQ